MYPALLPQTGEFIATDLAYVSLYPEMRRLDDVTHLAPEAVALMLVARGSGSCPLPKRDAKVL